LLPVPTGVKPIQWFELPPFSAARIVAGVVVDIQEAVIVVIHEAAGSPATRSRHVVLGCHF